MTFHSKCSTAEKKNKTIASTMFLSGNLQNAKKTKTESSRETKNMYTADRLLAIHTDLIVLNHSFSLSPLPLALAWCEYYKTIANRRIVKILSLSSIKTSCYVVKTDFL